MRRLRYPMRVTQDPDAPEFWNAEIVGPGPDLNPAEKSIMTCGNSPEEARDRAPECLTAYLLSRLEHGYPPEESPGALPRGKGWEWVSPSPRVEVALMIREAREEAKLTQAEAAKLIGVAQATYTRWEQPGKCNATLSTLEKVARAFGRRVEVTIV